MKTCPYCAEEIQDAAVVCKHCGRDLAAPPATSAPANRRSRVPLIALLVAVILTIGLYIGQQLTAPPRPAVPARPTAQRPPAPPPITVPIADGKPVELKTLKWQDYPFTLPARFCTVTGDVEGVSGGGKDFEGFVLDEDNYRNWSTSHHAKGHSSGRVVVWHPNLALAGPGTFHLIVSNAFSSFTNKVVTVQASATCR